MYSCTKQKSPCTERLTGNTGLVSDRQDVAGPSGALPTFLGGTGISTSTYLSFFFFIYFYFFL